MEGKGLFILTYRQTSSIRCTKSQRLNVSRLALQLQSTEARCLVKNGDVVGAATSLLPTKVHLILEVWQ